MRPQQATNSGVLNLSIVKRINSVTSSRRVEGTALDFAFFGAGDARLTYLKPASEFAIDEEMEEVGRVVDCMP
jgi:hypothetical protein